MHLALWSCGSTAVDSTNHSLKIFWKISIPESSKKQKLDFLCSRCYVASMHVKQCVSIVLAVVSNLRWFEVYRKVHVKDSESGWKVNVKSVFSCSNWGFDSDSQLPVLTIPQVWVWLQVNILFRVGICIQSSSNKTVMYSYQSRGKWKKRSWSSLTDLTVDKGCAWLPCSSRDDLCGLLITLFTVTFRGKAHSFFFLFFCNRIDLLVKVQ